MGIMLGAEDEAACNFHNALHVLDIAFTGLFTLELILKVLANGLLVPYPEAYLRDWWNVLDFVIVSVSLVTIPIELADSSAASSLSALKMLRALRALRPLRVISRNPVS